MAEELRVIVKAKELAKHTFVLTSNNNRYPKKYRHSLCDCIQVKALKIYDTLYEANRINNKTSRALRCDTITRAITYCDELLFYIELSLELVPISKSSAEYWSKMVADVKHMALAWRKQEQTRQ